WPLKGASDCQFKKLCHVLWEWDICDGCKIDQSCLSIRCPWQKRSLKLQPFFRLYQKITASYMPEMHTTSNYALRTHEDLFEIIQTLKQNPTTPRANLTATHFARRGYNSQPHLADQNRAFDLAVRAMTTVDCSIENQSGSDVLVWEDDKSFQELVRSIGSTKYCPVLADDEERSLDPKEQLSAIRLKKGAHIKFRGTDDIKNHLRLEGETVEIFHHTSILKEHLRLTRYEHAKTLTDNPSCIEVIPRQLALETLGSLQEVLFPYGDIDSHRCLKFLSSSSGIDQDCLIPNSEGSRRSDEKNVRYTYWGPRMRILLDELENPSPRGLQQRWERISKQRHMMQAAVIGIMVTVLLGLLSL
ncbi:hypothetical protein OIDMADRAFT_71173, partial [Oidiodendron maius Zn]